MQTHPETAPPPTIDFSKLPATHRERLIYLLLNSNIEFRFEDTSTAPYYLAVVHPLCRPDRRPAISQPLRGGTTVTPSQRSKSTPHFRPSPSSLSRSQRMATPSTRQPNLPQRSMTPGKPRANSMSAATPMAPAPLYDGLSPPMSTGGALSTPATAAAAPPSAGVGAGAGTGTGSATNGTPRPLAWLLRTITDVYEARFVQYTVEVSTGGHFEPFPAFVFHHFVKKFGLESLVTQAGSDLMVSIQHHRAGSLEADTFGAFLVEEYTAVELMFFLMARSKTLPHAIGMRTRDAHGALNTTLAITSRDQPQLVGQLLGRQPRALVAYFTESLGPHWVPGYGSGPADKGGAPIRLAASTGAQLPEADRRLLERLTLPAAFGPAPISTPESTGHGPPVVSLPQPSAGQSSFSVSRSALPDSSAPGRSRSPIEDPDTGNDGRTLYVAGFTSRTSSSEIERKFDRFGHVDDVFIVRDPRTHESRGFCFVTMKDRESAAEAARELHRRAEIDGRYLEVEVSKRARARPKTPGQYLGKERFRSRPPPPEDFRGPSRDYGRDSRRDDRYEPYRRRSPVPVGKISFVRWKGRGSEYGYRICCCPRLLHDSARFGRKICLLVENRKPQPVQIVVEWCAPPPKEQRREAGMGVDQKTASRLPRLTEVLAIGVFAILGVLSRCWCSRLWALLQHGDSIFDSSFPSNTGADFVAGFFFESQLPAPIKVGILTGFTGSWSTFSGWQKSSNTLMFTAPDAHGFVQGLMAQWTGLVIGFLPWAFGRYLYRTLAAALRGRSRDARLHAKSAPLHSRTPTPPPTTPAGAAAALPEEDQTPPAGKLARLVRMFANGPETPPQGPFLCWLVLFMVAAIPVVVLSAVIPTSHPNHTIWFSCCLGPLGAWLRFALSLLFNPKPAPAAKASGAAATVGGHDVEKALHTLQTSINRDQFMPLPEASPSSASSSAVVSVASTPLSAATPTTTPAAAPSKPWFFVGTYLANLLACLVMAMDSIVDAYAPSIYPTAVSVGVAGALSTVPVCIGEMMKVGPERPWHAAAYWVVTVLTAQAIYSGMNAWLWALQLART
ncbi:hypothetical protein PAPYR_6800 [Paratrimastix pyriformis]|uniref:RRM domain-containing protein n=1 Tax=Paratrimastix pyriformis TaxID=342808 RepID=A0ABQ8UEJ0_9EUKA|nr:hypothetical protein PAPYR_6800 [Paratrimastix pyriformis]